MTGCDIRQGDPLDKECRTCGHVVSVHRYPSAECSACELVAELEVELRAGCVSTDLRIPSVGMTDEPTITADSPDRPLILEQFTTLDMIGEFPDHGLEDRYRWRVRHASNGEILCSGEPYSRADDRDHVCAVLFPDLEPIEVEQ